MYVDAGELDKRIRIIRRTAGRDADGYDGPGDDETVRKCWAKFSRISGTEAVRAGADFGVERSRFLVRATRTAIDRKMLVLYAGKEYPIVYVNEYGDSGEYLEILCERKTTERTL